MLQIALVCLLAASCTSLELPDPDRITFPKSEQRPLFRITRAKERLKTDDNIVFPGQTTTKSPPTVSIRLSEDEMNCFKTEKVYYRGECHELLRRGPCRDGEWLVLDIADPNMIRPKCEKTKCGTDYAYVQDKGCVFLNNQTICTKPHTGLYSDPFGLGVCNCKANAPYAMYKDDACYDLYSQGPCEEGYIFVEKPNLETECKRNVCHRKNGTYLYWPKTKKCYKLMSQGPCPDNKIFQIGIKSRKPVCGPDVYTWHLIDLPKPNCDNFDQDGNCVDGVSVSPQGEEYLAQLLLSGKKRKKRLAQ